MEPLKDGKSPQYGTFQPIMLSGPIIPLPYFRDRGCFVTSWLLLLLMRQALLKRHHFLPCLTPWASILTPASPGAGTAPQAQQRWAPSCSLSSCEQAAAGRSTAPRTPPALPRNLREQAAGWSPSGRNQPLCGLKNFPPQTASACSRAVALARTAALPPSGLHCRQERG